MLTDEYLLQEGENKMNLIRNIKIKLKREKVRKSLQLHGILRGGNL